MPGLVVVGIALLALVSGAQGSTPTCLGKPATIIGTSGNDKLAGTSNDDVIVAKGGNDDIDGQGGDDRICGGGGNDQIDAGPGKDQVSGSAGDDQIDTADGEADVVDGGKGADTCKSDSSDTVKSCASTVPAGAPCATSSSPPSTWEHVVWIVMENHSYSDIIGSSDAPYINGLADQCGLATNYYAITHPSLPNYIALTSGSTQGITDSNPPSSHPLAVSSLFSQLGAGGWRSLEESMPSNCYPTSTGDYKVTHNPATYYTDIADDCATYDEPLAASPDISAKFTLVTPDRCHDMHDCSISTGDDWLKGFVPKLTASPEYQGGSTAIFVVFDEDNDNENNHIPVLVISPTTPAGTRSDSSFNHYSLLRTTEEMLGITTYLGEAADASSMRNPFHL